MYGFVAEDVAKIFPKAVQFDIKGNAIGIDYAAITYSLVESVQLLVEKINTLENKLEELSGI